MVYCHIVVANQNQVWLNESLGFDGVVSRQHKQDFIAQVTSVTVDLKNINTRSSKCFKLILIFSPNVKDKFFRDAVTH